MSVYYKDTVNAQAQAMPPCCAPPVQIGAPANVDPEPSRESSPVDAEQLEKEVEGKKADEDAPPVNIGWDSHKAVVSQTSEKLKKNSPYRNV